jgi:hypothetical protein
MTCNKSLREIWDFGLERMKRAERGDEQTEMAEGSEERGGVREKGRDMKSLDNSV